MNHVIYGYVRKLKINFNQYLVAVYAGKSNNCFNLPFNHHNDLIFYEKSSADPVLLQWSSTYQPSTPSESSQSSAKLMTVAYGTISANSTIIWKLPRVSYFTQSNPPSALAYLVLFTMSYSYSIGHCECLCPDTH